MEQLEVIMRQIEQPLKFWKPDFSGQLSLKMLEHMLHNVTGVREQVNKLEELRLVAYENARIFKEKTKIWHDNLIRQKSFQVGDQVLLYNSRLRLFPGKLKSRWTDPCNVTDVTPYGTIEIQQNNGGDKFKVNGHRLKMYFGGHFEQNPSVTLID
uniref:Reverse transcriptase domain-containing protein n=1 Tax=Nicotiana tabacum TaxID=4097 RepID=A0A1S4DEA9_TOBAC|nr:PREDICTED: uncharacterized protein LOC107828907 [Nicotiana tabacum]